MKIGINQFCWPMTMDILDIASRSKQLGFESLEVCFDIQRYFAAICLKINEKLPKQRFIKINLKLKRKLSIIMKF